ncbi:MAG: hypothetical protein QNJ33_07685 [Crocosphaera sp.]|nr:hypothetical protein [Crocosphaera sp.]
MNNHDEQKLKEEFKKFNIKLKELTNLELQKEQSFVKRIEKQDIPIDVKEKWNEIMAIRQEKAILYDEYLFVLKNNQIL